MSLRLPSLVFLALAGLTVPTHAQQGPADNAGPAAKKTKGKKTNKGKGKGKKKKKPKPKPGEANKPVMTHLPQGKLSNADVYILDELPFFRRVAQEIMVAGPDAETHDIHVTAEGGTVRPLAKAGRFEVIATAKNVELTVYTVSEGTAVGQRTFKYPVVRPPLPRLELLVNGILHDGKKPIGKSSRVKVRIKQDASWRNLYPDEFEYELRKIKLLVHNSLGAPVQVAQFDGSLTDAYQGTEIDLTQRLGSYDAGTTIYFYVDRVYRRTSEGDLIEQNLSERERLLDVRIKD